MSDRARLTARGAPLVLVAVLAMAWLAPDPAAVAFGSRGTGVAERVAETLDAMPDSPLVVVGFDPDVGTYAEIRPAARALLDELRERDARLAFVNLTPEGRALLVAELARLDAAGATEAIVDLGFVPGAEAAIVSLSRSVPAARGGESPPAALQATGLSAADLLVVVGGNDLGPRTWVEQALPRLGGPPMIAVAPTVLLPELLPYVASGQIDALVGTAADVAAYRAEAGGAEDRPVDALALFIGLAAAIGVPAHAVAARAWPGMRIRRRGEDA